MEIILLLVAAIILLVLIVARPFLNGAFTIPAKDVSLYPRPGNFRNFKHNRISKSWKFDPHEEKILHQLLASIEVGISVNQLNELLNLSGKSAENQRQRRHLVIKELNTKLFVLFNFRECIVRLPEAFDSRKKQYVIFISQEVYEELRRFLAH